MPSIIVMKSKFFYFSSVPLCTKCTPSSTSKRLDDASIIHTAIRRAKRRTIQRCINKSSALRFKTWLGNSVRTGWLLEGCTRPRLGNSVRYSGNVKVCLIHKVCRFRKHRSFFYVFKEHLIKCLLEYHILL